MSRRFLFVLTLCVACDCSNISCPDGFVEDEATTSCVSLDAAVDAGVDGGEDAGVDAGLDAGEDAGVDGGEDAGVDAGLDAGGDAEVGPSPDCIPSESYPDDVGCEPRGAYSRECAITCEREFVTGCLDGICTPYRPETSRPGEDACYPSEFYPEMVACSTEKQCPDACDGVVGCDGECFACHTDPVDYPTGSYCDPMQPVEDYCPPVCEGVESFRVFCSPDGLPDEGVCGVQLL